MPEVTGWIQLNKSQLLYCAEDNSELSNLSDYIDVENIYFSHNDKDSCVNLGIRRVNDKVFSSNFVGICRMKNNYGGNLRTKDNKQEVLLKIVPRFSLSVVDMLNEIKNDDEFERYLAPQTIEVATAEKDIEELENNEVFHFFDDEDPIHILDNITRESSVITSTVYISLLRDLCRRPLIGKMITQEENLVGKVKGKIVFSSNIKLNTAKGRDDRIFCRYLRYSEDIIENQVLKAALNKASQFLSSYFRGTNAKSSYGEMIAFCNKSLDHVSKRKVMSKDLVGIKATGCYAYYKPVISVAKMVLNEITVESNGDTKTTNYVVPYAVSMSALFEMYCRAMLKSVGVRSYLQPSGGIHIEKFDYKTKVFESNTRTSANYISGPIKPDILLKNDDTGERVIFDVKYKRLSQRRNARNDRLQLLAYCLMYNCTNIGILFPSENKSDENGNKDINSYYYDKHKIGALGDKEKYYHQLEIYIGSKSDLLLRSKSNPEDDAYIKKLYDYITDCFSESSAESSSDGQISDVNSND